MLGWGWLLQSQPYTHLLALSSLFPILERGSELSQPMQVSRQDGQLPTEPPMNAGLEGASLHPVHAPIQACTRVSGHVFAHESVHQASTTTSPRGSSSTRQSWLGSSVPLSTPPAPHPGSVLSAPPLPKAFGHRVSSSAASKAQARGLCGPPSACPWAQLEGVPGLQGVQIRGCRGPGHGSARLGVPPMLLLASSPVRGEGEQRVEPAHGQTREL